MKDLTQIKDKNYKSIDLEIGFGKGDFLLNQSLLNKDTFYIGVEIQDDLYSITKKKIDHENVLLLNEDANNTILRPEFPSSLSTVHIYYPSPYRSKKYQAKEIISESFFKNLHHRIKIGGVIRIVTDSYKTYVKAKQILIELNYWFQKWVHLTGIPYGFLVNTICEQKYFEEGKQFTIFAQKI